MSESTQIQADMPLTVTLTAAMWQRVMMQLGKGTIETLGPVYGEIDRQLQASYQQQQQRPKPNGEVRADA